MILNHDEMIAFNDIFVQEWPTWVERTPQFSDSTNNFLRRTVPVGLSVRFGQDISICKPQADLRSDAKDWDLQRPYGDLRYLSVALATHISAEVCDRFIPIPEVNVLRHLREEDKTAYNHWDPRIREEITPEALQGYPVVTEKQTLNKIYDQHGEIIPRVKLLAEPGSAKRTAGVLVNLGKMFDIFEDRNNNRQPLRVTGYPQAYCSSMGHVNSNDVPAPFHGVVDDINMKIRNLSEDESVQARISAVQPIGSQCYNLLSHRLAPRAGTQEVQKGDQTAAMASAYKQGDSTCQRKGRRYFRHCEEASPVDRHGMLLELPRNDIGQNMKSLRAENVFLIDMLAIPASKRNGK